ncbi:DUF420 domain-containing protein [Niabella aquatica]
MLKTIWKKNDKRANWLIVSFSVIVFLVVAALGRVHLKVDLGFDVHIFALLNAVINSAVAVLLVGALVVVKKGKYELHKKLMLLAMVLSILFLVSYICHHLFAGETRFGGTGGLKTFYYVILFTHIPLAGIILPFILFTAYRGLTGEYARHKKIAKITWPLWLYVAITGVLVYVLISPYY